VAFFEREPRLTPTFWFLSGWVKHISEDPMPNTPQKTIVGHYGLGDAQVTWLGMFNIGRRCAMASTWHARILSAKNLKVNLL
jgi:hypothetical protein